MKFWMAAPMGRPFEPVSIVDFREAKGVASITIKISDEWKGERRWGRAPSLKDVEWVIARYGLLSIDGGPTFAPLSAEIVDDEITIAKVRFLGELGVWDGVSQ